MARMEPIPETRETESNSQEIQEIQEEDEDQEEYEHGRIDFGNSGFQPQLVRRRTPPRPRSPANISILGERYEFESRILGRGSTSVVKIARDLMSGERVAIKIMDKQKVLTEGEGTSVERKKDCVIREISIMKMLRRHPNIVRIIEVMSTETWIYIVMELVTGGPTFSEQFTPMSETRLITVGMNEDLARSYFQQLISAVDYFHSIGVSHRDLKVSNFLLDANGLLKVGDFGMSSLPHQKDEAGMLHTPCGTLHFIAPEVLKRIDYDGAKADIWSCGVILFYLVGATLPFTTNEHGGTTTFQKILNADLTYPPYFSASLIRLLRKILQRDPATRVTMDEIFEDEWFKKDYQPPRFLQDSQNLVAHRSGERTSEPVPVSMNVFEILNTYFMGHNIIGEIFEEVHDEKELRFISESPVGLIINGIQIVTGEIGFVVQRKSNVQISIEGGQNVRRKGLLSIATEIFEIVPSLHIVEFRIAEGDVLEFKNFCRHITSRLDEIIRRAPLIRRAAAVAAGHSSSPSRRNRSARFSQILGGLCPGAGAGAGAGADAGAAGSAGAGAAGSADAGAAGAGSADAGAGAGAGAGA